MTCKERNINPLTLIRDKYDGIFCGGNYIAFNKEYGELPMLNSSKATDSWIFKVLDKDKVPYGVGDTPCMAIENLYHKIRKDG